MSKETFMTSLPSPQQLKNSIAVSDEAYQFIKNSRTQIINILNGKDPRQILAVGPCSIHSIEEAKEYSIKIKQLQSLVKDQFFILMRIYFAKSRTSIGWKGLLFDPNLDNTYEVEKGMRLTRELLAYLAENQIPAATEFLELFSIHHFEDLISWGCIGARTAESQTHREVASGLDIPIGFKNNTNGDVQVAIKGAYTASKPHIVFGINSQGYISQIQTSGNPYCHLVLRGGNLGTNYDPDSISISLNHLKEHNLLEKIMIDCSHGNSKPNYNHQAIVFESVINQIIEGNSNICGLIIESNHFEGRQDIPTINSHDLKYGISVTDPCISWDITERLILWGYEKLQKNAHLLPKTCET